MLTYSLDIREHNIPAHLDLEDEIFRKKEGLLTVTLRVNNGNIVDLTVIEYTDVKRYLEITGIIIQESQIA